MPFSLVYTLLLFSALFLGLEAPSLFRGRAYKELIITSLLLALGLFYGIDYALDWQFLPNPNILLTLFKPVSESMEAFFQITG